MIDPEFFLDDEIAELNFQTRLLYIGLWGLADDAGVIEERIRYIKAQIFPYDDFITDDIFQMIEKLIDYRKLVRYEVTGRSYLFLLNFHQHQNLDKPTRSYPLPENLDDLVGEEKAEKISNFPLKKGVIKHFRRAVDEQSTSSPPERNRKEIEKKRNIRDFFEKFWEIYPKRNGKRIGKAEALRYLQSKITDEEFSLILQAVQNYASSTGCRNGYAKDAIRFLRNDFWRDWIDPEITDPTGSLEGAGVYCRLKDDTPIATKKKFEILAEKGAINWNERVRKWEKTEKWEEIAGSILD